MEDEKLANLTDDDLWGLLEESGLSKIFGITQDEFKFIGSLIKKGMSEEEIIAQLLVYRHYKDIKHPELEKKEENK